MIITEPDLTKIRKRHATQKIILALGTFDLLHCGHVEYLDWSRQCGDILVVAVNCDREVRARKGVERPIIDQDERAAMVDALRTVDYVVVAHWQDGELGDVPFRLVRKLCPEAVTLGCENSHELPRWNEGVPGVTILIDPGSKLRSTSSIVERVLQRHAGKDRGANFRETAA